MLPSLRADRFRALIVASWFPAVDEMTRGRFVADQARALADGGRVEPAVISFETIGLTGSAADRRRQAQAVDDLVRRAIRRDKRIFSAHVLQAPNGVAVARLPIPAGGPAMATDHPATHRRAALLELAPALGSVAIVHAHTGFPDGAASVELARRLGVPLVITEHASFVGSILADPPRRAGYLAGVSAAARFIAVSAALGRELVSQVPELGPKLVVIPNAVDVDAFRPAPLAGRRLGELLYVGYRIESKGIELLLRATALVRRERPAVTLRLIGRSLDEATERRWQTLALELGISDAVAFDPPELRPGVAAAMARGSVLVHASPRETFGMTAVEALASGMPVVAVDSGGVTETLAGDGSLGEIAPSSDPAAFAAAIVRTLDRREGFDPDHLRASVVARFGAAAVATRLADLYEEVSGASGRAPVRVDLERPAIARANSRPAPGSDAAPALPAGNGPSDELRIARDVLVVAFITHRAERILRDAPPATLAAIHLLCGSGDAVATLPAGLQKITPVDIDGPFRDALGLPTGRRPSSVLARAARVVRDPLGVIRRRLVRARRERFRTEAARSAIQRLFDGLAPSEVERLDVVGVDGIDYLALSLVPTASERVVPGGLRWLVDQLAVSRR
ncbi:MAG TPA: glycosyltransferase [Patescibacteria group bacterium]|nr:glycosyltransferase [Patescibacteria group bacterium]